MTLAIRKMQTRIVPRLALRQTKRIMTPKRTMVIMTMQRITSIQVKKITTMRLVEVGETKAVVVRPLLHFATLLVTHSWSLIGGYDYD